MVPGTRDFLFAGVHSASSGATGSTEIYGSIDGVEVLAPTLDPGFASAQFVRGGVDASGVAHVLIQAHDGGTFDRELVVETRDPITHAWTGQVFVAASDPAVISFPTMFVAPNGHAFVRYLERTFEMGNPIDTTRTYHRGPSDSSFVLDTTYDVVSFDVPCLAYGRTAQAGAYEIVALRRAPGAALGAEEVAMTSLSGYPSPTQVAVDEAGHCFFTVSSGNVVHNATYDQAWSAPMRYQPSGSGHDLFAGATNEAYLVSDNGSDVAFVRYFAPLAP